MHTIPLFKRWQICQSSDPLDTFRRLPRALTALEAAENAPALVQLAHLLKESANRLAAILPVLPLALRHAVQPGPIDDKTWCLFVTGAAVSAKLRQLIPAMEKRLADQGWPPRQIRIRILVTKK